MSDNPEGGPAQPGTSEQQSVDQETQQTRQEQGQQSEQDQEGQQPAPVATDSPPVSGTPNQVQDAAPESEPAEQSDTGDYPQAQQGQADTQAPRDDA